MKRLSILSGNQLKLIALITMTIDHIGVMLLPQFTILRIIGRLAFPIFAFMIAEGCRYTRSRSRYLMSMAGLALACQLVYLIAMQSLYQCVLVTFSISICLIYALDNAIKKNRPAHWLVFASSLAAAVFVCRVLPLLLPDTDFAVDYSIWGVILPVAVYLGKNRGQQLILAGIVMLLLSFDLQGVQWYSLIALVFLAAYSGKRGKLRLKYLFYIYYPLHLVLIYAISALTGYF